MNKSGVFICSVVFLLMLFSLATARTDLAIKADIQNQQSQITQIGAKLKAATSDEKIVLRQNRQANYAKLKTLNNELISTMNGDLDAEKSAIKAINVKIAAVTRELAKATKQKKKAVVAKLKKNLAALEKQKKTSIEKLLVIIQPPVVTPVAVPVTTSVEATPATQQILATPEAIQPSPKMKGHYQLPVTLGFGAGTFLMGTEYKAPLEDNFEGGFKFGGGIGNNFYMLFTSAFYQLKIDGTPLKNSLDLDYAGLSLDGVYFSNNIVDIPGVPGTVPEGVRIGGGPFIGKTFGNIDVRAGYSTILGINAETTAVFTF